MRKPFDWHQAIKPYSALYLRLLKANRVSLAAPSLNGEIS